MRTFLLSSGSVLVWVFALVELIIGLSAWKASKKIQYKLLAIICFGLYYDALVIAMGRFLDLSLSMQLISQMRFIIHGVATPLLIPIGFYILGVKKKSIMIPMWVITGALMAAGAVMGVMTELDVAQIAGTVRFVAVKGSSAYVDTMNSVISIGCIIPLIITGLLKVCIGTRYDIEVTTKSRKGKKRTESQVVADRSPLMLIGALCMFFFSAIGPATGNTDLIFLISMFGEILMVSFLLPALKEKEF